MARSTDSSAAEAGERSRYCDGRSFDHRDSDAGPSVAQALIREAGKPIAAPSAKSFGYVSPTYAQHVLVGLGDRVDLILDGGPCSIGVESTIVSMIGTGAELLRPGSVTLAEIREVIGSAVQVASSQTVVAPGQLPRHYATRTPVTILSARGVRPVVQNMSA